MKLLIEAANAAIGVHDGRIVEPDGPFDVVLRIPGGRIRPGLINAHDHLHRNHYGRLGRGTYPNAYEWGRDIHARDAAQIASGKRVPRRRALLRGAWKNLLAGVTTVVHHDRWEEDFDGEFPIRVARTRWAHSPGLEPELAAASSGTGAFAIHLAEGTDAAAAEEVRELDRLGLLTRDLLAVHAVGVDADGVARLRASGAAVVWCPTSNLFLLGCTAPPSLLAPGMDVLLGSDSLLSGEGSLLDEIRVARELGLVSDKRLLEAVGCLAARRLGLAEPSLEPGEVADLAVFTRPLLEAGSADVALVMVGGVVRVLDPGLVPELGRLARGGRLVRAGGVARWVNQRPRAPRIRRQTR